MAAGISRTVLILLSGALVVLPLSSHATEEIILPDGIEAISQKLKVYAFDDALQLMQELSDLNHPKRHLLEALLHELGIGTEIDSEKALEKAQLAAGEEDWEAAQYLAWRAIEAPEGERNLERAIEWREKLNQWKERHSSRRVIPETLLEPESNSYWPIYKPITDWNHEKARAGDPVAQYNMFISLFEGRGTESDSIRAMHWLMRATDAGNGPAARWLSTCYQIGLMTKENPELALKYLRIAAEAGDAAAQYDLGIKLIRGRGVEEDPDAGISWLKKAAAQNHRSANYELAVIFHRGEIIERDYERAWSFYSRSVELGYREALYDLGWMAFYGQGVEEDPQEGIRLLEEAAENGHSGAALRLGKTFLHGWKTEPDPGLAKHWADKAISLGNEYAHYILGRIFLDGLCGEVDYESAFYHFELAAREGDEKSQIQMGNLLMRGQGIERDLEEAHSWYKIAADKGNDFAAQKLLFMEGLGWGTPQVKESLFEYFEQKSRKPLSEVSRISLSDALNEKISDAMVNSPKIELEELLKGTEYEGIPSEELTSEQKMQIYLLLKEEVERLKSQSPPPDEAARQAEWQEALEEHIHTVASQGGASPPQMYRTPTPPYPRLMRKLKVEDEVTAILIVGADGLVKNCKFEQEPLPQFKEAIEFILPQWRFLPGMKDGKPVATRVRIPIPFRFNKIDDETDDE